MGHIKIENRLDKEFIVWDETKKNEHTIKPDETVAISIGCNDSGHKKIEIEIKELKEK